MSMEGVEGGDRLQRLLIGRSVTRSKTGLVGILQSLLHRETIQHAKRRTRGGDEGLNAKFQTEPWHYVSASIAHGGLEACRGKAWAALWENAKFSQLAVFLANLSIVACFCAEVCVCVCVCVCNNSVRKL